MKKIMAIALFLVLALSLVACGKAATGNNGPHTSTDYPAAITADGEIYLLSASAMPAEIDKSAIIGYTTSYTDAFPEKDGETNFSRELNMPYARVEGGIAVLYENEWYLCTPKEKSNTAVEPTGGGAPPSIEFPTAEELIQNIKEVKENGAEDVAYPWGPQLYGKDYICFLKETPLPEFEQEAVMLVLQGTAAYYQGKNDTAVFIWSQGYEKTEELTERYSLEQLADTKFFVGTFGNEIHIFWWENGDQFEFMYPADTSNPPEEVVEHLTVEKFDF